MKYTTFCRGLTKIYSFWSPKYIRLTHDPFEPTKGDHWTNFLQGLDRKIFNIILGVFQTKSRPIRTYKRPLFDQFLGRLHPLCILDYITTLLGVQEATILFFFSGMGGHEETILHFSISWLFTSFCISRNMLFTQRCATRFVYALLTDQKVILSFSPLHRSRQTRKTCQLCKENLSVMQGSLQNWSIYELCQSYARN